MWCLQSSPCAVQIALECCHSKVCWVVGTQLCCPALCYGGQLCFQLHYKTNRAVCGDIWKPEQHLAVKIE